MVETMIVLAALVPVLTIGAVLIELLLHVAPRRGKRPDNLNVAWESGVVLRVILKEGDELRGSPRAVASRLLRRGWGECPVFLSGRDADRLLRCWEEEGRVRVHAEWNR